MIHQLREYLQKEPTAQKVVFVPSMQVGYNLSTALGLAGVRWVNCYFVTPFHWARALVGPGMESAGWRPLVSDAAYFIISDIVDGFLDETDRPGYLRESLRSPSTVTGLRRAFDALRLAGVEPSALRKSRLAVDKREELGALYDAYVRRISELKLYDRARVFEEALKPAEQREEPGRVAIVDATPITGLAYRFVIDRVDSSPLLVASTDINKAEAPPELAGARFPASSASSASSGSDVASTQIRLEVLGTTSEVVSALRDLLYDGQRLDDIEIVYSNERTYLSRLYQAVRHLDIPCAFASGIPVTMTRTGAALHTFLEWVREDRPVDVLVGMSRARLIDIRRSTGGKKKPVTHLIAKFLAESRGYRGPGAHRFPLDQLIERKKSYASGPDVDQWRLDEIDDLEFLRKALDALDRIAPSGSIDLREFCSRCVYFLDRFAAGPRFRNEGDTEVAALASLRERLEEIGTAASVPVDSVTACALVGELLANHRVEVSVAQPGKVFAAPLEKGGYSGRRYLVIVGMDEKSFPSDITEDPLLLDHERKQLSSELSLRANRVADGAWHLERLLCAGYESVVLTANRHSLIDNAEWYSTPQFKKIEGPSATRTVLPSEKRVLTLAEALVSQRGRDGFTEFVVGRYSQLAAGAVAIAARDDNTFSEYNGWVGRDTPELVFHHGERKINSSSLEILASCPYRFFLREVMGIRPLDIDRPRPGHWLTPKEAGTVIHDVLCTFMETMVDRGEVPNVLAHGPLIETMLDERLAEEQTKIPPPSESVYAADRDNLLRMTSIFLSVESQEHRRPVALEMSFGYEDNEPLPIELHGGVRLAMSGRIDRIDKGTTGDIVWDYKSGRSIDFTYKSMAEKLKRLQWLLYAYAWEDLGKREGVDRRVESSGYYFLSPFEGGGKVNYALLPRDIATRLMQPMFDLVERGFFPHTMRDSGDCKFCDFRNVCGNEQVSTRRLKSEFDADDEFVSLARAWMGGGG